VKNRTAPVPSTTAGQLSAGLFWALFLGLFAITALPVLHVVLPPFVDYPNHLARMHVLIEQPRSEALQRYYEIRWRPLPNLAMDLVVPMLARVMTLDWAGKVFILMYLALLPGGTALLHRVATGRWSVWPLFAFLFLYTHVLIWGFPNYLFGLGLALPAFALWLALAKRMAALRTGVASAGALVIFFAHLEACAIFALLIAGHEIGELWRRRAISAWDLLPRALAAGLPFVIPLAILVADGLGGELGDIRYEGLLRKLEVLPMFEGHVALDIATVAVVVPLIAVGFLRHCVTVVPALRAPLLLLVLAYLLAPVELMTAHGIDERLPLAIVLVLAAGTTSLRLSAGGLRVAALAGLALFLARVAVTELDYARANQIYPRLIALLDQVPRGGRLAVAFNSNEIGSSGVPINHLPTLAVIRRDAFVPTLFALETQQPVSLTPAARALRDAADPGDLWAALMAGEAGDATVRSALAGFDALVVLDAQPFEVPATPFLAPVGVEPDFALYRIVH
jgi:hypothetical protein